VNSWSGDFGDGWSVMSDSLLESGGIAWAENFRERAERWGGDFWDRWSGESVSVGRSGESVTVGRSGKSMTIGRSGESVTVSRGGESVSVGRGGDFGDRWSGESVTVGRSGESVSVSWSGDFGDGGSGESVTVSWGGESVSVGGSGDFGDGRSGVRDWGGDFGDRLSVWHHIVWDLRWVAERGHWNFLDDFGDWSIMGNRSGVRGLSVRSGEFSDRRSESLSVSWTVRWAVSLTVGWTVRRSESWGDAGESGAEKSEDNQELHGDFL
jgi:hypothetical protein